MHKFNKQYYRSYEASGLAIRKFVRERLKLTPKVKKLFRIISDLDSGAKLLDVGSGIGGFLELVEQENPHVETYGLDMGMPSKYLAGGRQLRGSAMSLPFQDNSFDVVTCSHVIEHLLEPVSCAQELYRVCKQGGYIYIEAPSPRSSFIPFFSIFWDDPTHIRPHSRTSLKRLLEISGSTEVKTGIKRSLPAALLGLLYVPVGLVTGDRQAKALFSAYLFGFNAWAIGRK